MIEQKKQEKYIHQGYNTHTHTERQRGLVGERAKKATWFVDVTECIYSVSPVSQLCLLSCLETMVEPCSHQSTLQGIHQHLLDSS